MSNPHPVPDQASSTSEIDPYVLHESRIKEPPGTFKESLKYLGPGFILSASIVGSGELFATTIAGADAGFVLMWFIIFSCLVKVAVQLEFGKHAISSGEATMTSLNTLPGPRFKGANWSIWAWLLLMVFKMMQVGGIVGGVVWAIEEFAPAWKDTPVIHIPLTFMVAGSVSLLIFRGYYTLIEKASLIMIGGFTLFTVISLCSLQFTDNAITFSQIGSGLIPSVPDDMKILFVAMGAFGITGVGGDEVMAYNYWLIEKGYAAYTGPRNDSPEWEHRAKGWIKVMYWDAICSMVAYTAMTVMFYLHVDGSSRGMDPNVLGCVWTDWSHQLFQPRSAKNGHRLAGMGDTRSVGPPVPHPGQSGTDGLPGRTGDCRHSADRRTGSRVFSQQTAGPSLKARPGIRRRSLFKHHRYCARGRREPLQSR